MFSELFYGRYDVSYRTGGLRTIPRLDKGGLMARKHEEYDWLNDPFDEKKSAEELERAGIERRGVRACRRRRRLHHPRRWIRRRSRLVRGELGSIAAAVRHTFFVVCYLMSR